MCVCARYSKRQSVSWSPGQAGRTSGRPLRYIEHRESFRAPSGCDTIAGVLGGKRGKVFKVMLTTHTHTHTHRLGSGASRGVLIDRVSESHYRAKWNDWYDRPKDMYAWYGNTGTKVRHSLLICRLLPLSI